MSHIFTVAPSTWEVEHHPAIRAAELYQASHDGALPSSPAWRALERRHDLDPTRFSHWHPNISLMIARSERMHHDGPAALVVRDRPPTLAAPSAPEPPSAALWCVGLAVAYLAVGVWNRRRVLIAARDVIDGILERSEG